MSRSLPKDVADQIAAMPADFAPEFQDRNSHVRWAATLDCAGSGPIEVELGFSRAGQLDEKKERENLRASAWQATELARLGRRDLLDYCRVGRHKRT